MNSSSGEMRSNYKATWLRVAGTLSNARMSVASTEDERELDRSGAATTQFLLDHVGIEEGVVALEIGCGVGRVGKHLARHCARWIGSDVSSNMLRFAAENLQDFPNAEFVELSGYDLQPISSESVDFVYCTVVFPHLTQWDRFNYVEEAFRVLRPRGKLYVDNVNLCSESGWRIFQDHRRIPPLERIPEMAECSTPQELIEYLRRAGFESIMSKPGDELIAVWGQKPGKQEREENADQ
jgi:ubiquinone/menaquinone biosynthesis C-methylase UbiE